MYTIYTLSSGLCVELITGLKDKVKTVYATVPYGVPIVKLLILK